MDVVFLVCPEMHLCFTADVFFLFSPQYLQASLADSSKILRHALQ